jgi:hypothetical protein
LSIESSFLIIFEFPSPDHLLSNDIDVAQTVSDFGAGGRTGVSGDGARCHGGWHRGHGGWHGGHGWHGADGVAGGMVEDADDIGAAGMDRRWFVLAMERLLWPLGLGLLLTGAGPTPCFID